MWWLIALLIVVLVVLRRRSPGTDALLFERFPLTALKRLPHGNVPVPYHAYDADSLVIVAGVDGDVAQGLVGDGYRAVRTSDGRGIALVWVMDYRDTAIGTYRELVSTFLVAREPLVVDAANPFEAYNALLTHPKVCLLMHKLWVSSVPALEYGRLLLGADKILADIRIERSPAQAADGTPMTRKTFRVLDRETQREVFSGSVLLDERLLTQLKLLPDIVLAFGVRVLSLLWARVVDTVVLGMPGVMPGYERHHPALQARFSSNALGFNPKFQRWGEGEAWGLHQSYLPDYARLDLQPRLIVHGPSKFVFLSPYNPGDEAFTRRS